MTRDPRQSVGLLAGLLEPDTFAAVASSGHKIVKCVEHDRVVMQCRCPGPKALTRVPCPTPRPQGHPA